MFVEKKQEKVHAPVNIGRRTWLVDLTAKCFRKEVTLQYEGREKKSLDSQVCEQVSGIRFEPTTSHCSVVLTTTPQEDCH